VKAAVLGARNVDAKDISVETRSWRVVLSGLVPDQSHAYRAIATARDVDGVLAVESRLVIAKD
jgi:osmotically-inducible protein OsmY